ncbi:cytochrome P450 6B2-like [Manduca sexta]|uniref:cytochrome P450 6B2-like n=1 Tax=Manduca sexta TaxID=7130 RepID=UPI00188E7267|nr:cytochrome P450 6B2-like [Manduca sexta]
MILIITFVLFLYALYVFSTKNHNYWKKRNIKHDPPIPLFGNHFVNQFGYKSITQVATELYNRYPEEKVVGYYQGTTPLLLVRDLEIVRRILTADFSHFYLRGLGRNPDVEPIFTNLFHTEGDSWKLLRQRLTPTFTTAKLKAMFPLVVECAKKLQGVAEGVAKRNESCDVRELVARFTTEFIGACGFGINMDTINNEKSMFRNLGKLITSSRSLGLIAKYMLWENFPYVRKFLYVGDRRIEESIVEILQQIRKKRNYKPSGRNDFIDLLLELEAQGKITGESIEKRNSDGTPKCIEMDMDMNCMVGQVFVFFAAGFETSSSASSYTLHQLAYNPDIQRQVQENIDEVLNKYNGELCYDAIAEMKLLSMAFKEAMRMFPSLGVLSRVCARRYTIPELNNTIDPGVKILIPLEGIQNDEKYFTNPKEFRPQRFSPEAMKEQQKFSYMSFGEGPRACIGARLGEMQSLAGLAAILHKFTVEPAPSSRLEVQIDTTMNVIQKLEGGLYLTLKSRKSKDE